MKKLPDEDLPNKQHFNIILKQICVLYNMSLLIWLSIAGRYDILIVTVLISVS